MKLCVDCTYFEDSKTLCTHPKILEPNLVRGGPGNSNPYVERLPSGRCGPDAKLFEPKTAQ